MVRVKIAKPAMPEEPEEPEQPEEPGNVLAVEKELFDIEIYPNPATNQINIKVSDTAAGAHIDIYGPTGSRISYLRAASNGGEQNLVDITNIPPGVYTLRVVTDSGKVAVSKFVRKP